MRAREAKPRAFVATPCDVARLVRPVMHDEQETFVVLCLDIRNGLLGRPVVVALGTVSGVEVHPRDVFRAAVKSNAAGIVVTHNHPTGNPKPSDEDIELTRRLRAAGELLGIPVVDHVVVTCDGFASLSELGLL